MTAVPPQVAALPAGYRAPDLERRVAEPPKSPGRGEFARDRARVLHSSALRRLAAKTQVVDPGTVDFVRTRLTHSLEVAQVGRELAGALGCDPDVVDTACLAHDLGHPPFGHNGEEVLARIAAGIGGFEGNAQTLRLLTRLEPKVIDPVTGRGAGLNLTRASLDACTKYPWPRGQGPAGSVKFGVYPEDLAGFTWLRDGAPPARPCLEAQLMDLADDVAYCVHDVEDAVVAGHLDPGWLRASEPVQRVAVEVRARYLPDAAEAEVAEALARLRALPGWLDRFDGGLRALAALKNLSSTLIGRFVASVRDATLAGAPPGPLSRYRATVVVPRGTAVEVATLKAVAAVFVMTAEIRRPVYSRQQELLTELTLTLADRAPAALEPVFAEAWWAADDDAGRLRSVVDQVASLTDSSAVSWHRRLAGPGGGPGSSG